MTLDGVPTGQGRALWKTHWTDLQVEGLIAHSAPEMVVVPAPDRLVAGILPRQINHRYLSFITQSLDGPVDRRYAQPRHLSPRPFMYLGNGKRSLRR